jgi:hypothetical protein
MERKLVQGKEYIFEKVQIEDRFVTLAGIVSSSNSQMVEFRTHRPEELLPESGQLSVMCSIEEFMQELKFLAEYLNNNGLNDENFVDSLLAIVEKHIIDFGRIIDNDLYAYIDKALILQSAIYVNYGSQLNPENATKIYKTLFEISIQKFRDNIYLTEYDLTNPLEPKPYLVKVTEKYG